MSRLPSVKQRIDMAATALSEVRRMLHDLENIAMDACDLYALARLSAARECLNGAEIQSKRGRKADQERER